jgi:hypothetical protein
MADERDPVEHTTIIETDRGGNGGVVAVVVLVIIVLGLLFLFRSQLGLTGAATSVPSKIDVNVNSN